MLGKILIVMGERPGVVVLTSRNILIRPKVELTCTSLFPSPSADGSPVSIESLNL